MEDKPLIPYRATFITLANSSGLVSSLTSMLTSLMDNLMHHDTSSLSTETISGKESLT